MQTIVDFLFWHDKTSFLITSQLRQHYVNGSDMMISGKNKENNLLVTWTIA